MKKILFLILLCPFYAAGIPESEFVRPDAPRENTQEAELKEDEIEKQQEETRKLEEVRKAAPTPDHTEAQEAIPQPEQPTAKVDFAENFKEFNRQKALRAQRYMQEDAARNRQWSREDEAAAQGRDNEGFFTRFTKKTTADAATDTETQLVRNKTILEINKERIFEEFKEKSATFDLFKKQYSDFSAKAPFDTLLQLGDMNKFVNMSHDERTVLINDINDAITKTMSDDSLDFQESDIAPLQDLIRLTRFHSTGNSELPADLQKKFDTTFTTEFSSKTPEQQQEIKQNLINILKESVPTALDTLTKFNSDMEEIKNDIDSLETLRTIKNAGNAAFWVLGTVAGVCMLGHTSVAIKGVQLTMEKFAIGAKVGYVVGHKAADIEAELTKNIQTKMQAIFKPLLPETMELIETISYENKAKSLTQRAKEGIKSLASKADSALENSRVGNHYRNLKDYASRARDSVHEGLKEAKRQVTSMRDHTSNWLNEHESYRSAKNLASSVGDIVGQKASDLSTAIKSSKAAKAINEHLIDPLARRAAARKAEKLSTLDTSEFDMASKPGDQGVEGIITPETEIPAEVIAQKPLAKLDFSEYRRQDALLKLERKQEDELLFKQWEREDRAAAEVRDKEGFATRLTHKASSDDATDKEKQATRNKTIQEINRQRTLQDFTIKAARFETFKKEYSDFSTKAPWDSVLELGDMNKFVDMTHEERTELIDKMNTAIDDLINDKIALDPTDIPALLDLAQLTRDTDLTPEQQAQFESTVTSEFESQTPEQQEKIKQQLLSLLKESLPIAIKALTDFDTAMEEIKGDISKLEDMQTLKGAGYAAFWVLGTTAGVIMFSHQNIVIKGIQFTMEKFAIGAKIGYIVGHKAGSSEAELEQQIQNKMTAIFKPLLPKTTELIETITYKNNAKGIGQRVAESLKRLANKAQELANKADNGIESNLSDDNKRTYRSLKKNAQGTIEGAKTALSDTVHNAKNLASSVGEAVGQKASDIGTYVKSSKAAKAIAATAHDASTAASKAANAAGDAVDTAKAKLGIKTKAQKVSATDTSKHSLATPKPKGA